MKLFRAIVHIAYAPLTVFYAAAVLIRLRLFPRRKGLSTPCSPEGALRVAYLLTELWAGKPGGAASHKAGFCKGLKALGHIPTVIASDPVPGLELVVDDYNFAPKPAIPTWLPRTIDVLSNNLVFSRYATSLLRQRGVNVICQRNIQMNISGALVARALRLPFILEYNSPANWKRAAVGQRNYLIGFVSDVMERVNFLAADRIVVVSGVLKARLVEEGVPEERISVNANGADADLFHPDIDPADVRDKFGLGQKVVVGFAGSNPPNSVATWHGVKYLASAVARVARENPAVHFLFIGDQGLEDLVRANAPSPQELAVITFAKGIPHPQMPKHYAACDILVSPHVHMADGSVFFGSPVKIFEYMAMGKAIVASNVGQLSELLHEGENALLTKPQDVEAIAGAILKLAADVSLRRRLGGAARATCVSQCTWRHNAERFINACRRVTATP